MRSARRLTLLAVLAIAATGLAAPSALAQTEPLGHNQASRLIAQQEIHNTNDPNCPLVSPSPPATPPTLPPLTASGGCRAHVTSGNSDVVWSTHVTSGGVEVVAFSCRVEFDIRLDVAGEGYVTHQEFTGGASCTRKACGQIVSPDHEGQIWSVFTFEAETAPKERMTLLFCTEAIDGSGDSHCEVTFPLSQPTTHRHRFTATDASGHGGPLAFPKCEWDAVLDVEETLGTSGEGLAEQHIELRHT